MYSLIRDAPSLASMPSRSPRILASQISRLRWISLKLFLAELSALLVLILASAGSSSPKLLFAVSACSVLSFCLVSVALCWRWNASSKYSVCRCVLNSELSVESQGSFACCTNRYRLVFLAAIGIRRWDKLLLHQESYNRARKQLLLHKTIAPTTLN